jgi:HNH endonuclease/NUMOD4 motif
MPEVWLEIEEAPRYLVSNYGRVQNRMSGQIFKPHKAGLGYLAVKLMLGRNQIQRYVHRLVAETFFDGDSSDLEVNHIDGDKWNNCLWNLEWVTSSENKYHAYRTGLKSHIASNKRAVRIIETNEIFDSIIACAESINGYPSNINACLHGNQGSHRGLHFEYV